MLNIEFIIVIKKLFRLKKPLEGEVLSFYLTNQIINKKLNYGIILTTHFCYKCSVKNLVRSNTG
jgi:hypothetical protein